MNLRLAHLDDIGELIKMRWDFSVEFDSSYATASYEDFERDCGVFLQKAITGEHWFIWVAEVDDRIVSHIYLQMIEKVPRPGKGAGKYGFVTNVYTVPDYRIQSIGSKLHAEIERWAIESKIEFLIVWPSSNSVTFYERNGFQRCGEAMEKYL